MKLTAAIWRQQESESDILKTKWMFQAGGWMAASRYLAGYDLFVLFVCLLVCLFVFLFVCLFTVAIWRQQKSVWKQSECFSWWAAGGWMAASRHLAGYDFKASVHDARRQEGRECPFFQAKLSKPSQKGPKHPNNPTKLDAGYVFKASVHDDAALA